MGLAEAKQAVEALAAENGIVAKAAGCASVILLWILVAGSLAGICGVALAG